MTALVMAGFAVACFVATGSVGEYKPRVAAIRYLVSGPCSEAKVIYTAPDGRRHVTASLPAEWTIQAPDAFTAVLQAACIEDELVKAEIVHEGVTLAASDSASTGSGAAMALVRLDLY